MQCELKQAHLNESDEIARLFRVAREVALPYLPKLHTLEDDRRFFRDVFDQGDVWTAHSASTIVGFCAFRIGWVDHLYVHPEHQRHGLGSALIEKAKQGNSDLQLWVFQRNTDAIHFYRSKGFKLLKTTAGGGNEEQEPDALYAWSRK